MPAKKIPAHVIKKAALIRKALSRMPADRDCPRCDGKGYVERDGWIVTEEDGRRRCFRCGGKGHVGAHYPDPIKVRYSVAYRLLPAVEQGNVSLILAEEAKAKADIIYWPILEDVYLRALSAAERVAGC